MSDLFSEVDEAMRQERMEKLFKQYGIYLAGFVVMVILSTAGFSAYNAWSSHVRVTQTDTLLSAFDAESIPEALNAAGAETNGGVRGLALMQAAGVLLDEGDKEVALSYYKKASQDPGIPAELKDLATLAAVRLNKDAAPDDKLAQLQTIWANESSPWRFHARLEAAVISAHHNQDYAAARDHLQAVIGKKQLPESILQKAHALDHVYALKAARKSKEKSGTEGEG